MKLVNLSYLNTSVPLSTYNNVDNKTCAKNPLLMNLSQDTIEISSKNTQRQKSFVPSFGAEDFTLSKRNLFELKQLPENIEFQPSQTFAEAIAFGEKTLGVKYIGFKEQDLDIVNWVNEGLVNVSNALKGKVRMPSAINFTQKGIAESLLLGIGVDGQINGQFKGHLLINKKFFAKDLDLQISEHLTPLKEDGWVFSTNPEIRRVSRFLYPFESIDNFVTKVCQYEEGKMNTFNDKVQLLTEISDVLEESATLDLCPMTWIRFLLKQSGAEAKIKNAGLPTDLVKIKRFSESEQNKYLDKLYDILAEGDTSIIKINHTVPSPFYYLYHEMGHINDAFARTAPSGDYDSSKWYPAELKKWINNDYYQDIAMLVSIYAASGPGEFIAEVFANTITGVKYPEKVMKLYRQLKGPALPKSTN